MLVNEYKPEFQSRKSPKKAEFDNVLIRAFRGPCFLMSRTDANRLMSRADLTSTLMLLQTAPIWFALVKGILIRLHIRRLKLNEGLYAEAGGGGIGALFS